MQSDVRMINTFVNEMLLPRYCVKQAPPGVDTPVLCKALALGPEGAFS
jgi:hypothetical protein